MERGRSGRIRQNHLSDSEFLTKLRDDFNIGSIYYPGCGSHKVLESTFTPSQIYYADVYLTGVMRGHPNTRVGDMAQRLYPDRTMDAMFYQDADVEPQVLRAALRAVKVNGILVFSSDDCGYGVQLKDLAGFPEVAPIDLGYTHRYFNPFRKLT